MLFCTRYQRYPPFFETFSKRRCFLLILIFENGTACHNSGFPVRRDKFGVYIIIQVWARGVSCVTRACAVRNAVLLSQKKKPPVQIGATLSLRTWVRAPASIFVIAFFFLLFHLFLRAGNFAQALYQVGTYLGISWELHGSPQLLPCLFRDRCEVYLVLSWARVPCVACACAVRSALYFFPSKK